MQKNNIKFPACSEIDFQVTFHDSPSVLPPLQKDDSHIHAECEIYINVSGDVSFEVENAIYPITKGSVIITRPYEYHHCIYHSDKPHSHYWILFSPQENSPLFHMFFQRKAGENNLIQLSPEELYDTQKQLSLLLSEEETVITQNIALLKLLKLLESANRKKKTASVLSDTVLLALEYMEKNLSEDISVSEIAKSCYVSINTLERQFRKHLQASPQEMLRKKRLLYSANLLRNGATVTQAWEKSGFSDYSHYITCFRKFFCMTPLKYQKKLFKK